MRTKIIVVILVVLSVLVSTMIVKKLTSQTQVLQWRFKKRIVIILELVQPIRSKEKIEQMKKYLKSHSLRDYTLFTLGINSGLRISDLLKLNVSDIVDENGKIKERITVKEKKTSKVKTFPFSSNVVQALKEYIVSLESNQTVLFGSRKGDKSITRQQRTGY